eukprot:scaffold20991_cov39-Phaeocystis_antarctica.AAC.2
MSGARLGERTTRRELPEFPLAARAPVARMVSLLATTSFALHTPLALWFDRRSGPASAAPRADDGFDQVLQLSGQAGGAPGGGCLCVTPESKLEEEGRVVGAALCVGNAQEQSAALALVGSVEWILVEAGAPQPCIAC